MPSLDAAKTSRLFNPYNRLAGPLNPVAPLSPSDAKTYLRESTPCSATASADWPDRTKGCIFPQQSEQGPCMSAHMGQLSIDIFMDPLQHHISLVVPLS